MHTFDYILVGGGLQNGLVALALGQLRPAAKVLLLEANSQLGGNHTWCFHSGDVNPLAWPVVEPLIVASWSGYSVKFPGRTRRVAETYSAVSSQQLHNVLMARAVASGSTLEVRCGEKVRHIEPSSVETESGMHFGAPVVIDSRGPELCPAVSPAGFQKFVGLECLADPTRTPREPILMDATIEQSDGYRFFYTLPFEPNRILIEDTYYSDTPDLDVAAIRAGILQYADRNGFRASHVIRQETGVLPLPRRMPPRRGINPALLQGGYFGGWFHPTTGYSFPIALKFATTIAQHTSDELVDALRQLSNTVANQQRYCLLLNRMLFDGFEPSERVPVFERFYGMPIGTIRNFYALDLRTQDRIRLLCGRPPPGLRPRRWVSRALRSLNGIEQGGGA